MPKLYLTGEDIPEGETHLTDAVKRILAGITKIVGSDNLAAVSCFVDGEPSVAIAFYECDTDDNMRVTPMFVAVTQKMQITDHDGEETKSDRSNDKDEDDADR